MSVRKTKFTIIQDTREQVGKGWRFNTTAKTNKMEREKLDVGDYSIKGLEHIIFIERKTVGDLWGTLGNPKNYERFLKEMERAKDHAIKFLIIEGTLADINKGYGYSKVPQSVIHGKLFSLQLKHGMQVVFAGRKDTARTYVRKLLEKLHRYHLDGTLTNDGITA